MKPIIIKKGDNPVPSNKPQRDNVIMLSPKWTKCELSYHFVLDFNSNSVDIIRLVCRNYPLKQHDVFDILPDWARGIFCKVKRCTVL